MASGYIDAGYLVKQEGLDYYDPESDWPVPGKLDSDSAIPIVRCEGCGSLVSGGHETRSKHDAFHTALADLFEKVSAL